MYETVEWVVVVAVVVEIVSMMQMVDDYVRSKFRRLDVLVDGSSVSFGRTALLLDFGIECSRS